MKASLVCGVLLAVVLRATGLEYKPIVEPNKPIVEPNKPIVEPNKPELPDAAVPYNLPTTPPVFEDYDYLPYGAYNPQPFEAPAHCIEITDQTVQAYRHAIYNLTSPLYNRAAVLSDGHFVFSPYTVWLSLAALAEGASGLTQKQLLKLLSLPENACDRQALYQVALKRESSNNDVVLARNRLFVFDSSVQVNKKWEDYIQKYTLLKTVSVPYKVNPVEEIEQLKKVFKAHLPNIDLSGNSLLLESLDYHVLWTSVFDDAVIQQGPFYNSFGEQIGVIDYMKTVKKANIGIIPSVNMKVIDLPVGRDGRYRIYFAIPLAQKENFLDNFKKIQSTFIIEAAENLKMSDVPVEIVLPKMSMTSEVDIKQLLVDIGVKSLWTVAEATRNISEPAALPSAYIQRVTFTLDNGSVHPATQEYHNFVPPVYNRRNKSYKESSFVANKPFIFGLFDSKSLSTLIAASFSKVEL